MEQIGGLRVRRVAGSSPQFKQPVELTGFSKFRTHYTYDYRNLVRRLLEICPVYAFNLRKLVLTCLNSMSA